MSKIKVIIIAAVAAVIGYCGVTYYMGEKTTTTKVKEVISADLLHSGPWDLCDLSVH